MSNASFSRLNNFLLRNQWGGAWALGEFGLLVIIGLLTARPVMIPLMILPAIAFVAHCVAMIRRRVWDPWFTVLAILIIYFLAQALAGLLVYIYPLTQGWSQSRATFWLNNSVIAQFCYFTLATGLTLSAIYGYLRHFRVPLRAIGLRRPRWDDAVRGLLALPVYFFIYILAVVLISQFVPGLDINQKQELGFDDVRGVTQLVLTFMSLVVLPPLMEEIIVRGLLYSSLKRAMPVVSAVLVTSAIFASAHLPEGGATGPLYIAALDTFVLSLVLIYLREKTGGLWASMTLHALKNGVAFAALFVFHVH